MNIKIKIVKENRIFEPETDFLRLSNFKSKKFLKWNPKWTLKNSLNKILDWYYLIETMNPRKVCEDQIREFIKKI